MDTKELERSLSMDEILKTIRSVVSEGMEEKKENDILELTEIVETGNPVTLDSQKNKSSKDILEAIDEVVGKETEKQIIEAKSPAIEAVDLKAELIAEDKTGTVEANEATNVHNSETALQEAEIKLSSDEKNTKMDDTKANIKIDTELKTSINTDNSLISEEVLEASAKALKALVAEDKLIDRIEDGGSKLTLEDLIIKLLKPELSRWLDKNLSTIIQRIVEKEIKKIIPKAKK